MKRTTLVAVLLSAVSCRTSPVALSVEETTAVCKDVQLMASSIERDVSQKGPAAWA